MSDVVKADIAPVSKKGIRARPWRGLSGKVLLLTALFVMMGEVLIFVPSIANFRINWLQNKIAIAEIAALAVEAAPNQQVSDALRDELLKGAGVEVVALQRDASRHLLLKAKTDIMVDQTFDLRSSQWHQSILEAFKTLFSNTDRIIGVVGVPPNMSGEMIELALNETPLRKAMVVYSTNILKLSVVLSVLSGLLVFLALNYVLVRPMRRFTMSMLRFAENPEDKAHIITPTARADEIGIAERELAHMQHELLGTLQQKNRLAQLGLAVSKISHDLRNMLASAQIISDRLASVDDPTVKRFAPKLLSSLDRAIGYCAQTLKYGRAEEAPPARENVSLKPLIEEVIDAAVLHTASHITLYNDIASDLMIDADRDHLFRILNNLVRNATEALHGVIGANGIAQPGIVRFRGWREGSVTTIEVRDNGPGLSPAARQHLFEAFRGSARAGGTGLGLTISHELVRAHGGDLQVLDDDSSGAVFHIIIPDEVKQLHSGRRGQNIQPSQQA